MARVDNIVRNLKFAALCQVVLLAVNFVVRRIFVLTLGQEYLGLNGLFADILSMLSLAELGFGTSILYSLYKPVAEGDTETIKALMQLYRRAYRVIGLVVLTAGTALTPFLDLFVREMPDGIPHIRWIYLLNVVNSALSYFFIYKASLLFAYQKKYIELLLNAAVKSVAGLLQIFLLLATHNYFLYLGVTLGATLIQNLSISLCTDRAYPYLRQRQVRPLRPEERRTIWHNVAAMVFHKFGEVAVFSTDSILMARFVSVAAVGLYSNYIMIRKALLMAVDMLFGAITPTFGNVNASESLEHKRTVFFRINFFSGWLFGWMSICLLWLYNPFISLWLGEAYLFPMPVVALIVANFYLYCMRLPVGTAKNAMGLFWNDRYKPIAEVILNLIISVVLAQRIGIAGVLAGTVLSTVAVPLWIEPLVLYRHGLELPVHRYFAQYAVFLGVTCAAGALTGALCSFTGSGPAGFAVKLILCAGVPQLVYLAAYARTEEFHYLCGVARRLAGRLHRLQH